MPTSYLDFKEDIKKYVYKRYDKTIKILDIGPGEGTYAKLLIDYKNIDCVEVYKPYIKRFGLNEKYKNVYNSNILDFDFDYYDVIIMGDILEHLTVKDSLLLMKKIIGKCDDIIISVPYLADFNYLYDNEPNKNELHIQVDLTEDVMSNRYPMLQRIWSNNRIGVYVKNKQENKVKKDMCITVYVDDNKQIIQEFYWLYKSFIYSGNYKTIDIIAFCNPSVINKLDITVINDSNVIIIPSKPASEIYDMWADYKFINSLYYMTTDESKIIEKYKYTLSTDCDVFVTKNLIDFRPSEYVFGIGSYLNDNESRARIESILKKLNLKYNFVHNIGTSFLYYSSTVRQFRIDQYHISKYLMENEFKEGIGEWGKWYKGVITMYAGEIVANQLEFQNIRNNILDSYSQSLKEINNDHYHIHAWPTEQFFSKTKFKNNEYTNINVHNLDLNIISNYCLYIATLSISKIKEISNYK